MKQLIVHTDPISPRSEAYRSIRTNIEFLNLEENIKTILFTSSLKGEGKTTAVANVAATLADAGKRVMLLDCDFRNPHIHKTLGISNNYGITDILLEKKDYKEYIDKVEDDENFHVLTAGKMISNPSELLSSNTMKRFVESLKEEYDYVFLDSPPVIPVTDATAISTYIDGVVVMCLARKTNRETIKKAIDSLKKVDANILGVVLNKVKIKKRNYKQLIYGGTNTKDNEEIEDKPKKSFYQKYVKRVMDFSLSLFSLIIFSPIMIICAILIKLNLGDPILFKQKRPGLNEKIFEIYKFRTMLNPSESEGLSDMERLTGFGKKLRSTSLDELPQLINILKGDMSIVGPRPLMPSYLSYYTKQERLRHTVRPGLTGLAQISGRNSLTWNDRLQTDVDYVKNISFLGDLKIIFNTFTKVLKREGIALDTDQEEESLNEVRKHDRVY